MPRKRTIKKEYEVLFTELNHYIVKVVASSEEEAEELARNSSSGDWELTDTDYEDYEVVSEEDIE